MPTNKKRLEWRIAEKYRDGLPALILLGPESGAGEEVWASCPYRPRDLLSMQLAITKVLALTVSYRAKGYTVSDKGITLTAMMGD